MQAINMSSTNITETLHLTYFKDNKQDKIENSSIWLDRNMQPQYPFSPDSVHDHRTNKDLLDNEISTS